MAGMVSERSKPVPGHKTAGTDINLRATPPAVKYGLTTPP
jgi:hypothetical protein